MYIKNSKLVAVIASLLLFSSTMFSAQTVQKGSVVLVKSPQDFEMYIKSGNYTVACFGSPTCGPCKAFHSTYYAMASEYPDVLFLEILHGTFPQSEKLLTQYAIRSFPTFVFFDKTGTRVTSFSGISDQTKGKIVAAIVTMKDKGNPQGTVQQQSSQLPVAKQPVMQQPVMAKPMTQQIKKQVPQQRAPVQKPVQITKTQQPIVSQQNIQPVIYYPSKEECMVGKKQQRSSNGSRRRFARSKSVRRPRQKQAIQ